MRENISIFRGLKQNILPGLKLGKGIEDCPMKSSTRPTSSSKTANLIMTSSGMRRTFLKSYSHTGLNPAKENEIRVGKIAKYQHLIGC